MHPEVLFRITPDHGLHNFIKLLRMGQNILFHVAGGLQVQRRKNMEGVMARTMTHDKGWHDRRRYLAADRCQAGIGFGRGAKKGQPKRRSKYRELSRQDRRPNWEELLLVSPTERTIQESNHS